MFTYILAEVKPSKVHTHQGVTCTVCGCWQTVLFVCTFKSLCLNMAGGSIHVSILCFILLDAANEEPASLNS
jgi:hypothetical protein